MTKLQESILLSYAQELRQYIEESRVEFFHGKVMHVTRVPMEPRAMRDLQQELGRVLEVLEKAPDRPTIPFSEASMRTGLSVAHIAQLVHSKNIYGSRRHRTVSVTSMNAYLATR